MPEKYTYLLVDFCCILFPFIFSFYPKIKFYKQWRHFIAPCIVTAAFFLVWDVLFTKWGVWGFNPKYVCGLYLFGLPLEEYLFFFCIPYCCVFTYYCVSQFLGFGGKKVTTTIVSWVLIVFLLAFGLLHLHRLYTSVTFILLALLLFVLIMRKVSFLASFFISFLIILLPFFVSNGILTGSFIAAPVVIYNNDYNLGFRIFTIPFEDVFYGMLLVLMNVSGFEYLRKR